MWGTSGFGMGRAGYSRALAEWSDGLLSVVWCRLA